MKAAPPLKAQLLVSLSRLSRQCASLSRLSRRASHGDCHSHCHSRLLPPAQRRLNQLLEAQRWTSPTTAAAHRRLHLDHHDDDIIAGVDGKKEAEAGRGPHGTNRHPTARGGQRQALYGPPMKMKKRAGTTVGTMTTIGTNGLGPGPTGKAVDGPAAGAATGARLLDHR